MMLFRYPSGFRIYLDSNQYVWCDEIIGVRKCQLSLMFVKEFKALRVTTKVKRNKCFSGGMILRTVRPPNQILDLIWRHADLQFRKFALGV